MNTHVYHTAVLVEEVLEYLAPRPGGVYVDVTFGGGGHTRAILEKEPECSVIAFDWDTVALETNGAPLQEEFGDRLTLVWGNFAHIVRLLDKQGVESVDGILADFGTSQHQIGKRAGFSFVQDTPLDMRMSPAHQKTTAADLVNNASAQTLAQLFVDLGQEKFARKIAHAIVAEREQKPFKTTRQLAGLIERLVPGGGKRDKIHPATRVFQALRIAVNKELENINSFLRGALQVLHAEGRLVCISFHSLEDRMVKQFMREQAQQGTVELLSKGAVMAADAELAVNPSSRSARLRAIKIVRND